MLISICLSGFRHQRSTAWIFHIMKIAEKFAVSELGIGKEELELLGLRELIKYPLFSSHRGSQKASRSNLNKLMLHQSFMGFCKFVQNKLFRTNNIQLEDLQRRLLGLSPIVRPLCG